MMEDPTREQVKAWCERQWACDLWDHDHTFAEDIAKSWLLLFTRLEEQKEITEEWVKVSIEKDGRIDEASAENTRLRARVATAARRERALVGQLDELRNIEAEAAALRGERDALREADRDLRTRLVAVCNEFFYREDYTEGCFQCHAEGARKGPWEHTEDCIVGKIENELSKAAPPRPEPSDTKERGGE